MGFASPGLRYLDSSHFKLRPIFNTAFRFTYSKNAGRIARNKPMNSPLIATDSQLGLVTLTSPWSYEETVQKVEATLNAKKIKVFARIDQAKEAAAVGLTLRPTTLFIFGDPLKGTPLMDAHLSLAIDLPLKALIYESNGVFINLNSPEFLQKRHALPITPFTEVINLFKAILSA